MRRRLQSWGSTQRVLALSLLCVGLAACTGTPTAERPPPSHDDAHAGPSSSGQRIGPLVESLDRPGWVRVRTSVVASEEEAPARARRRARTEAHRAAIEYVAGVRVRSNLLSLETSAGGGRDLVQILANVSSDALIVDEVLRESRIRMLPGGGYRVDVSLDAKVLAPRATAESDGFETELVLEGDGDYRDGDPLELRVRASRDARILVVVVSGDEATLLLPNRHQPETRVRAGEWLRFPSAGLAERGVRLEARLPEGQSRSEEIVLALALRGGVRPEDAFPASASPFRSASHARVPTTLGALLSPLAELRASDWAFDQAPLRIGPR